MLCSTRNDEEPKSARGDIMAAHAQGYTSAQLDAIIAYLKQ